MDYSAAPQPFEQHAGDLPAVFAGVFKGITALGAGKSVAQAIETLQGLADEFPREPRYRYDLAGIHNNLGDLLRATKRASECLALWQQAIDLLDGLATEYPSRPVYTSELARTLSNRGVVLAALRRHKEAETHQRQAVAGQRVPTGFARDAWVPST